MAIALNPEDHVTVEVAEPAEWDEAVRRELEALGLTYSDLAAQAADDDFLV